MGSSKSDLYRYIRWLREQLEIDETSYPINTIDLCSQIGDVDIQYHKFNANGFCGAILLGDKRDTIILNSIRNPLEQNFDCGHEIIHKSKHRHKGIDCFSCMELKIKRKPNISFFEWEANEGSAELLVPYELFLPEIKKALPTLKSSDDYKDFKQFMAHKFNVTDAVINFRFESLKYEIQQYLNGTPIERLEILSGNQQSHMGVKAQSLNDIENKLLYSEYHIYFRDTSNIDVYE